RLGFGERVDLFESDEPHGFTRPRRIAAARWMARWLLHRDEPIDEPESSIASDADLQCTRSGQVLLDFHGKSVFDLNLERAAELRAARESGKAKRSDAEIRAAVRKLIGLEGRAIEAARPRVVATLSARGRSIRKLAFDVEPGIVVPALDISAAESHRSSPVVVKLGVDWSRGRDKPGALDELFASPGRTILINPRGMGETDPA